MKVVEKQLKELRMYENNPRNNDQAVEDVAKSIKEFGFKVPMVIDANNVIVCGHTRYKACLKLGIGSVPCVVADDLTPDQIKAFRLVENKTNELASWDYDSLNDELESISLDLSDFDFDVKNLNEWFQRDNRFDDSRQEGNEEYNEFLDKFEQPKTTDDCYTPDNIYEVVADYVVEHFGKDKQKFVRPFYPNGDYKSEKYKEGAVVVDNPPFSILMEIVDFYLDRNIGFFLFAPGLMNLNYASRDGICCYPVCATITYENGAVISTGFLTNLYEDGTIVDNDPKLKEDIEIVNKKNEEMLHKSFPKYDYPMDIQTPAKLGWYAKYKEHFKYKKGECVVIRQLDAQKENGNGNGIFGNGILISERLAQDRLIQDRQAHERQAQDRQAQEEAKALVFKLSDREKEIQRGLR